MFRNIGWCNLVRIIEEELIAIGIVDDQEPITPRTLLNRNAPSLKFHAKSIQRSDLRLRFNIKRNEHQPLTNLLGPCVG